MPNLSNRIVASSVGPIKPRGVAWNGAGGWLIFSQSRQVNFSRTVSINLKRRGISSSVLVTSSPILASRDPPQQAQACRRLDDDALALDVFRPGLADRPFAREGADLARRGRRGLRGEFILGRGGDEVFEFQFQLLDQPRRALRALAVEFAFELFDPQLKMRDQRLVVRQLRPRTLAASAVRRAPPVGSLHLRQVALGFDPQPRLAFGPQRHKGVGKIGRKSARARSHAIIRSDPPIYSTKISIQLASDAMFPVDFSNQSRKEDRRVAPGR